MGNRKKNMIAIFFLMGSVSQVEAREAVLDCTVTSMKTTLQDYGTNPTKISTAAKKQTHRFIFEIEPDELGKNGFTRVYTSHFLDGGIDSFNPYGRVSNDPNYCAETIVSNRNSVSFYMSAGGTSDLNVRFPAIDLIDAHVVDLTPIASGSFFSNSSKRFLTIYSELGSIQCAKVKPENRVTQNFFAFSAVPTNSEACEGAGIFHE